METQQHPILQQIADRAMELVNAETVVVAIAESDGEIVHYAAALGKYAEAIRGKRGASATSGLCGTAFAGNNPVLICQTQGDPRVRQDWAQSLGITTALAVPLYDAGELVGALMALNRRDRQAFDAAAEQVWADYAPEAASRVRDYLAAIA